MKIKIEGLVVGVAIMALVVPASAQRIENLRIENVRFEPLRRGENFQIDFAIYKPPSVGPLNGVFSLELGFYVCSEVLGARDNYVENKTEYTLKGVVDPDLRWGAGMGIRIYWRIDLDNSYSPVSPEIGDNLIVVINGEEYSAPVIGVEEEDGTVHYLIAYCIAPEIYSLRIYVCENEPTHLYVTAFDYYVLHGDRPPPPRLTPLVLLAGALVAFGAVVSGLLLIKRKRKLKWVG
jgi:hypothetical protein